MSFLKYLSRFDLPVLLAVALALVMGVAEAGEPATNVKAVRDGTVITVTWTHPGAPDGYFIYKGTTKVSTLVPTDGRSYTLTGQPATGDVCAINVLARYVISQPGTINYRSESVCATDAPNEPAGELQEVGLTWDAPTEREDGSALPAEEIDGYLIYYGMENPPTDAPIWVEASPLTIEVQPGEWYFGGQTVDTDGLVSEMSVIAHKVVEEPPPPPDTTAPVLALLGDNPLTIQNKTAYTEPGATCTDETEGALDVAISGVVNTGSPGTYTLTYACTDAAGNQATADRTVIVQPKGKPHPPKNPRFE